MYDWDGGSRVDRLADRTMWAGMCAAGMVGLTAAALGSLNGDCGSAFSQIIFILGLSGVTTVVAGIVEIVGVRAFASARRSGNLEARPKIRALRSVGQVRLRLMIGVGVHAFALALLAAQWVIVRPIVFRNCSS